jgi:hypothetical protein
MSAATRRSAVGNATPVTVNFSPGINRISFELVIRIGNLIDLLTPAILIVEIDASAVMDAPRSREPITFGLLQVGSVFKTPIISTSGFPTSDLAKKLCVNPICRIALPALPVRTAAIRISARLRFSPASAIQRTIAR